MPTVHLSRILQTVSLKDLHLLASVKQRFDELRQRRAAIHRQLRAVEKKLESLQASLPPCLSDTSNLPRIRRAIQKARKERRPRQPTIETLIVRIFEKKKRPLSIREITHALLHEEGYKTTSANFRNQVRVLLYRNQKGLYQRVGTGQFTLAGPPTVH